MASNENDILLLSAYIDNELSPDERQALEARLQSEPTLQAELSDLQQTVALIKQMPLLKAPRNYTLSPSQFRQYTAPPRNNVVRWRFAPLAATLAAILVVVIGIGALLSQSSSESEFDSAAQAPASESMQRDQSSAIAATGMSQNNGDGGGDSFGAEAASVSQSTVEIAALPSPTMLPTSTPLVLEAQQAQPVPPLAPEAAQNTSGGGMATDEEEADFAESVEETAEKGSPTAETELLEDGAVETTLDAITLETATAIMEVGEIAADTDMSQDDNASAAVMSAPAPEQPAAGIMAEPSTTENEAPMEESTTMTADAASAAMVEPSDQGFVGESATGRAEEAQREDIPTITNFYRQTILVQLDELIARIRHWFFLP